MLEIKDSVAVITEGSGGIGMALARLTTTRTKPWRQKHTLYTAACVLDLGDSSERTLLKKDFSMQEAVIVSGARTAIGTFGGGLKTVSVVDMDGHLLSGA